VIVVIIAGGSGTRLWPLSTPGYPKHLLKINGDELSLLQRTYQRAKKIADTVYVISETSHHQYVKEQLPDMDDDHFIVEPARRGTASCIIAALVAIKKTSDKDEPIAFLAADHYIRDVEGFRRSFAMAGSISARTQQIVLVGVEPDYPATGFGYIEKGAPLAENSFTSAVQSFNEKPDRVTAQKYLNSGKYLWNCGYFVGSVTTFQQAMEQYAPEMAANYTALCEADATNYEQIYLSLENISIDYALIEKVDTLLVLPASFDWLDLGSFGDLAKVVPTDNQGNAIVGNVEIEDVKSTYVENLEDKPVAVIGLDNCVVINTPHGILVTRKDLSQKVGDISKRLNK
jgi:mannose-1-phosphate guanylyltransferase/mannose-6-phosphate isomerase